MVSAEVANITEQEAELYDRQIRLWGLDAQKRLRSAKICVLGLSGLGAEITKNLVLSGINSMDLVDDAKVSDMDATSQFLAPRDQLGQNRAEASLQRLQQLNPMVSAEKWKPTFDLNFQVKVSADPSETKDKDAEFFKKFDVVVATNCCKEEILRINAICRAEKVLFYAGDIFGFYGFSFMDLVSHEYVEEIKETKEADDKDQEPAAKKQKVQDMETKTVKKAMTFVSMAETLKVDWSSEMYNKRVKRMDPSFFLLQVLFEFQSEMGRKPSPASKQEDVEKLKKLRDSVLERMKIPVTKVTDAMMEVLFGELSPVCAIVGGVMAQEIIKAISNKDAPHNNYFFYNPIESCGVVETIGY